MAHVAYTATPAVIDDDVQRTAELIFVREAEQRDRPLSLEEPETKRRILEAICVALQTERNGWKERLQHTLHEIDRQHRAAIVVESSLQELVLNLGIAPTESPPSGCRSTDIIQSLQRYIQDLHDRVDKASDKTALQNMLSKVKDSARQLESEKTELIDEMKNKTKEVAWLHKELNTVRTQLQKLRQIVLNYNQSHSTNFHLEEESVNGARSRSDPLMSRERTYVEGDQLHYFSTSGEEIAVWKLRHRKTRDGVGGSGGGGGGGGGSSGGGTSRGLGVGGGGGRAVTQCLRCNQFFKSNDNNNLACRYHKKGRQIREQYDANGRLIRVLYTWACCKKGLDAPGCTYGCHI